MTQTVEITAERLLETPEMFLLGVDLEHRAALFLQMTRDAYKESAFLDDRAIRHAEQVFLVGLDELFELCGDLSARRRPLRYIFHTGFCCSTLLAKCVEMLDGCLVLKEPFVLHQLAAQRIAHAKGDEGAREWPRLLELATVFLSRAYAPSDAVVVKADCNFIVDSLLKLGDDDAAVLLYTELPAFILSVLKEPPRPAWARARLEDSLLTHAALGDPFGLAERLRPQTDSLSDAEAAGCFWLSLLCLYQEFLKRHGSRRVRLLEAGELLARPFETLSRLADFFGLKTNGADVRRALDSGVMRRHSKNAEERFDAAALSEELRTLRSSFDGELKRGLDFVGRLREDLKLPEVVAGHV